MKFELRNSKLNSIYDASMVEFNSFFELDWEKNTPELVLVPDRKTIDSLQKRETEDWVVGWVTNNVIYLLSPENYTSQSSHTYSDKKYFALFRHELVHCFTHVISENCYRPQWFIEGIAIFLSGQNTFKRKPVRLSYFLESFNSFTEQIYYESGFAIHFLVETYGKNNLITILKNLKNCSTDADFALLFESVYGFKLKYANFRVL